MKEQDQDFAQAVPQCRQSGWLAWRRLPQLVDPSREEDSWKRWGEGIDGTWGIQEGKEGRRHRSGGGEGTRVVPGRTGVRTGWSRRRRKKSQDTRDMGRDSRVRDEDLERVRAGQGGKLDSAGRAMNL